MSFGRDHSGRPGRVPPFRTARKRILIVCEGQNTEKQYLEQFARFHRNPLVDVQIAEVFDKSLVAIRTAKKLRNKANADAKIKDDAYLKYDSTWCVYDVDKHPMLAEAALMAEKNGIEIALSNPCIELWLILHLRESPGMQDHHKMKAILKKHVEDYDKNISYEIYHAGYEKAVQRAKKLDALAEEVGTPGMNPTTGVYRLTELIAPSKPSAIPGSVHKRHSR